MFDFLFKKATLKTSKLLHHSTDVHSHLLPGVDDGVPTFDDARHIIAELEALGVRQMILTPHIMSDLPQNRSARLQQHFHNFVDLCPSTIRFRLAGEYMLDDAFLEKLDKTPLTYDGVHLLVETSYLAAPPTFHQLLYQIQLRQLQPVLAHPERYRYMHPSQLQQLKQQGIKFQLNLLSLSGVYGRTIQKYARELLVRNFYDYVGFDTHGKSFFAHLDIPLDKKEQNALQRLYHHNEQLFQ